MNVVLVPTSLSLFSIVSDQVSSQRYDISHGGVQIIFLIVFLKLLLLLLVLLFCLLGVPFLYLYCFHTVLMFLCWLYNWHWAVENAPE